MLFLSFCNAKYSGIVDSNYLGFITGQNSLKLFIFLFSKHINAIISIPSYIRDSIHSIQQNLYNKFFGNQLMYSFKSSPLIQECNNRPRRVSKRQSNRPSKELQYKVANPFRQGEQQNFLPYQLREQIQDMEYISPTSITKISFPSSLQSQRRSSNFARYLHLMQNAAKNQEQKFQGLISKKQKKKVQIQEEMIQQQMPMNISEMDNLSIEMENCLNQMNYRDLDHQELSIFDQICQPKADQVIFYSQTDIQPEINNDFSCYFNS